LLVVGWLVVGWLVNSGSLFMLSVVSYLLSGWKFFLHYQLSTVNYQLISVPGSWLLNL